MAITIGARDGLDHEAAYLMALTDWLACASAGKGERAAQAARACGEGLVAEVAFAATAGHVLDFDDTFADGVAHVSATTAPAALLVAAHRGLSLRTALAAYAEGYEAMAAVAAASHPALYDSGWHPTAVCGPIGAAVAASRLLELTDGERETAIALAMLRAGGTRGAFGSDGKAIQVGLAGAAGVQAALLARAGARVDPRAIHGPVGFASVMGAAWAEPGEAAGSAGTAQAAGTAEAAGTAGTAGTAGNEPAIARNWIKRHPSCLGTHSPIDAAAQVREEGVPRDRALEVTVNSVARQAAHLDQVNDGLSGKFSIPYCVAHTLMHGPPRVADFASVDAGVAELARLVSVTVDNSLPAWGARLNSGGRELARVSAPRGAPERPLTESDLAGKVEDLAGPGLLRALDDLDAPAARVLSASGLG